MPHRSKTAYDVSRLLDVLVSTLGLMILSPILLIAMVAVWYQDGHSPFYIAKRIGQNAKPFSMVKLRSMTIDADVSGVTSTSASDGRVTKIGFFIRRYKIDEIPQLWNVLRGDMALVGPRPNVPSGVALFTAEEQRLLSVQPGVTDLSSIVFSDEGEILKDASDPDLTYNQLIRPWKSRLGLFYVDHRTIFMDLKIIMFTVLAIFNKGAALWGVNGILRAGNAEQDLTQISRRKSALYASPPPGSNKVVQ